MRIAHLIGSLDPAAGGPPAIMLNMAVAQAARGHEVTAFGHWAEDRDEVVQKHWSMISGLGKIRLERVPTTLSTVTHYFTKTIDRTIEKHAPFDVIHLHSVWDPAIYRGAHWARKNGVPYVILINGMLDVWSMAQSTLKKKTALALGYRSMLNRAGAIQAGNPYEHDILRKLGLTARIDIIPNGVQLEDIERETKPDLFRSAHPDLGDNRFVLFLSRLHYKKGLDLLADAWIKVAKEHPAARLVVAGPREDDSMEDFWRRLRSAKMENTAHEVGPIYAEMKLAAFRECTCYTLPSRQEGFSVAITEALGLGCAAVVTRDCHYWEITETGAGIETSLDPAEIAAGISRMLSDEAFRQECRRRAAALVRERFTWPRVAEMTEALYAELTA